MAAYRNTGIGRAAVPGTQLATSGSVACPVVGYSELALTAGATLAAGDWLALSADNVTATFHALLASVGDNNVNLGRQYRQATAHPAPSTPSGLAACVGYNFPLIGVA